MKKQILIVLLILAAVASVGYLIQREPERESGNPYGQEDDNSTTLTSKTWTWTSALYNDGREIAPRRTDAFKLTFNEDNTFSASTDCNGMGGDYIAKDGSILMSNFISTLMFCEGSQEEEFRSLLGDVASYHFGSEGELIFDLKFDSGSVIFK